MSLAPLAILAVLVATPAGAACYGTDSFQTCTDASGNNYNVQRYGGSTYMSGTNASTGSSWSQNTFSSGDMSTTTGMDSDGNTWSQNTTTMGGSTFTSGTDSDGNTFSSTCGAYGCY